MNPLLHGPIPPQLKAMMPANPTAATPQEALAKLVEVIDLLATRGPSASAGLKISTSADERGATIRIDLP